MAATLVVSPDLPVVIVTVDADGDPCRALFDLLPEIAPVVSAQPQQVFLILNLDCHNIRLDQISLLITRLTRGNEPLLRHANLRETLVVTPLDVIRRALSIVSGPLFDHVRIGTCNTLTEAVAYCHTHAMPADK